MIETEDDVEKKLGTEDANHNDLDGNGQPTFKSELTITLNETDESSEEIEDLVLLRRNNRPLLNRSAYSKLHTISNSRLSSQSLRKYEIPPKNSEKPKIKETKISDIKNELSSDEDDVFIPCVVRKSDSVDTIDKIEKELSNFVMDTTRKKEKKRTNSFRKFFSVALFGKDKKKKEFKQDVNSSHNSDYADNYHNEVNSNSFQRNSPQRHTVNCGHVKNEPQAPTRHIRRRSVEEEPPPEVLRKYADNHINRFNKIRQSFEYPEKPNRSSEENSTPNINRSITAPPITKYIDTSSSTSTLESQIQNTYQNVLIAQAELQRIQQDKKLALIEDRYRLARSDSLRRETPPRAQEIHQPVNIVKPKARLPINSGRPLPNPYHYEGELGDKQSANRLQKLNHESSPENEASPSPKLNEIYGTVFDAVSLNKSRNSTNQQYLNSFNSRASLSPLPKSPRSPSLENSKLKLPPNREITPLQPRMRSPLPPAKVSTEKIIATELLKSSAHSDETDHRSVDTSEPMVFSEKLTSSPQAASTPESKVSVTEAINALRTKLEANDQNLKQELDEIRSTLQNLTNGESTFRNSIVSNDSKTKENVFFGNNSPRGTLVPSSRSSATISPSPHIKSTPQSHNSMSPAPLTREDINRAESPNVELRQKRANGSNYNSHGTYSPSSPSKDEIRKSVEAYYWKEIKKIKEREDYEIYLSQLHFTQGGYPEAPSLSRRSRGMEDSRGRRSSSVPRNPRQLSFDAQSDVKLGQFAIPEGRTVLYDTHTQCIYGYVNPRASQPNTNPRIRGSQVELTSQRPNTSEYGTYKPIFRRGSLTGSVSQPIQANKKVSFSNSRQCENLGVWPTKNGFTKSPPQRRLERGADTTMEDDVFLPSMKQNLPVQASYGRGVKPQINNHYASDTDSIHGYNSQDGYNFSHGKQFNRVLNYNSDSEAFQSQPRRYRTLNHQELENLRNAQTSEIRTSERPVPRLTRHESIQLPEATYGYAVKYLQNQRGSLQPTSVNSGYYLSGSQNMLTHGSTGRDILVTDSIYGQHLGYRNDLRQMPQGQHALYSSHQGITEPTYVTKSKQITVRNKVCDIYGKIHDIETRGEVQASGVLLGQLQDSPNLNFRRGTRLTASNNDMLLRRRQMNYPLYSNGVDDDQMTKVDHSNGLKVVSVRPLPPLPPNRKTNQSESNKNTSAKKQLPVSTRRKKK